MFNIDCVCSFLGNPVVCGVERQQETFGSDVVSRAHLPSHLVSITVSIDGSFSLLTAHLVLQYETCLSSSAADLLQGMYRFQYLRQSLCGPYFVRTSLGSSYGHVNQQVILIAVSLPARKITLRANN